MEIFQGRSKHNRLISHIALFRFPLSSGDQQECHRSIPRRASCRAGVPNHADPSYSQVGTPLDRSPIAGVYPAELLQGIGSSYAVSCHGRLDILQPRLLRREGGAGH